MPNLYLIFFMTVLLTTSWGQALEMGCQFKLAQTVKLVDKSIRTYYKKQQIETDGTIQVPNIIPLQNQVYQELESNSETPQEQTQYEAVLRPKQSDYFHLLHLVMFRLERTRNLMYVCFNHNSLHPSENHVTIYFLNAYGLEPISMNRDNLSTIFGDWLLGPDGLIANPSDALASITRIPIELVPLHIATNGLKDFTENIPVIDKIFKAPGTAMQIPGNLINKINQALSVGVERIVVTPEYIEFASSVNLDRPNEAKILYRMVTTAGIEPATPSLGN